MIKYKWYIVVTAVLVLSLFLYYFTGGRAKKEVDALTDWAIDSSNKSFKKVLDRERRSSQVSEEKIQEIDKKIEEIKVKSKEDRKQIDKVQDVKELSKIFSDLGY